MTQQTIKVAPIDSPVHIHHRIDGDVKLGMVRASRKLGIAQNLILNSLCYEGLKELGFIETPKRKAAAPKSKAKKKKAKK